MKNTKLKIDNFVGNKLENLVVIKGGDEGDLVLPTGGNSNVGGGGSGEAGGGNGEAGAGNGTPFPPITPRSGYVAPGGEAPDGN